CENARIIIDEMANSLQQYSGAITFDPQRLENIRLRLAVLAGLKKKYGGTIDAILESKASAENELSLIENIDGKLEATQQAIDHERNSLGKLSLLLSEKRSAAAQKLAKNVSEELANLGMPKAQFIVSQRYNESIRAHFVTVNERRVEVRAKGIDKIEFLISANPGEEVKPLSSVASGGEISRIMLALKSLLAEIDKVPVLIFDEIDIGISGRIAQAVGRSLRKLAFSHQLVCITHLPQIASMAHHHFLVEKKDDGMKTQTTIRKLLQEERPVQIAQLFGGEHVTDAHLQSASDLIKESENLARND
ncbi:MAG: DNA repair protein RecN, partial [Actinobacteria bacterium]|nr:DNA repair protein RecN [Actinomycetota bacterium]